jgi:Fe-S cluster assembly iron-binding protein IscA
VFSLTSAATSALAEAREDSSVPEDWGVRFFSIDGQPDLTFDFVAQPEPSDIVGGPSDLRTYVAAEIHHRIGEATIDYEEPEGRAGLVIRPHPAGQAES